MILPPVSASTAKAAAPASTAKAAAPASTAKAAAPASAAKAAAPASAAKAAAPVSTAKAAAPAADAPASSAAADTGAMQDRFLKLLVAQLNNQDPMNPMDNAQMTSQMAQINTVTGIQSVNENIKSMAEQISTMQQLQGITMIGRSVIAEGNTMSYTDNQAKGSFDLAGTATSAKVEIVTPGGNVVDTVNLGSQEKGTRSFEWDASKYTGDKSRLQFRVVASTAAGPVEATPLAQAKVTGTGTHDGSLTLTLENGSTVNYSTVRTVL